MNRSPSEIYEFGRFRLDAAERILTDGEASIPLAPKVFDTLLLLITNAGRVVSKDQMLTDIWKESFVEENNLAQNISTLRRLFGESPEAKFIETVPKLGYRFVAPVVSRYRSEEGANEPLGGGMLPASDRAADQSQIDIRSSLASASRPLQVPETRYVRNGDVNIAYHVVGDGDIDIVFVMGWVSHLEYFWKHHLFASFLERLASFSRLILFDKRGTGLSDRVPNNELPTLEKRMEDVHAVMEAVGSERAVLIGVSEGGPMCSLFAATYPERTAALIMIGTYAKRIRDDDYPWAPSLEEREAFLEQIREQWGKPVGIEERAPSLADNAEFREWWATYLRMGASPGAAVALTRMNAEIDVRGVLSSIRVPTLVIHRAGDLCLKAEEGRYVASRIPDSKYVELGGIDHLPFVGDQHEILDEIERFLTGMGASLEHDRVLATVMSIRGTRKINGQAQNEIDRLLEAFKGKKVPGPGGRGVLSTFDGPARAIRCAMAIADSPLCRDAGLKIGLHTGECDLVGGRYGGFAVQLAHCIADEAEGGIVVSRTVKDLVAGSGLSFEEFGSRSYPQLEGVWQLFTVAEGQA